MYNETEGLSWKQYHYKLLSDTRLKKPFLITGLVLTVLGILVLWYQKINIFLVITIGTGLFLLELGLLVKKKNKDNEKINKLALKRIR